jgi:WD40 repeat protein
MRLSDGFQFHFVLEDRTGKELASINGIAVISDDLFATASTSAQIRVWDLRSNLTGPSVSHSESVFCLAFARFDFRSSTPVLSSVR